MEFTHINEDGRAKMFDVSTAALTIYDVCKAIDREMIINNIMLIRKSGEK
jgi:molybdenum cofactor biosynthesis enzyme